MRNIDMTPVVADNKKPFRIPRWFYFFILFLIVVGLICYFLFFSKTFSVTSVEIEGTKKVPEESVRKLADQAIQKKNNIWLFQIDVVEKEIKANYKEIDSVTFRRGLPHTIKIIVSERKPVILWQSGTKIYLVDDLGYTYEELVGDSDLPRVIDNKAIPVKLGERFLSSEFIVFVQNLSKNYKPETGKTVKSMAVDETTFELNLIDERDEKIIFDTSRDLESQLRNLNLAYKKTGEGKVSYIDLRVESWVYYK